jgi:hypothetical protein
MYELVDVPVLQMATLEIWNMPEIYISTSTHVLK